MVYPSIPPLFNFSVKCAVCKDFDLCLICFSHGVEVFPHRNDHAYRVMVSSRDCLCFWCVPDLYLLTWLHLRRAT